MYKSIAIFFITFSLPIICLSSTINIPADYPTIQQGIDAALNWDTVLVAPGTYVENIDFKGKAIIVQSIHGPAATLIDGNGKGSVVVFQNGESPSSTVEGFTLINGTGTNLGSIVCGGGICCWKKSSPTILNNIIHDNTVSQSGGAIACYDGSSPSILNNIMYNNSAVHAGGVMCNGSHPIIVNNTIYNNNASKGGGIYWTSASTPIISNTIIWANQATEGPSVYAPSGIPTLNYCDVEGGTGPTMVWEMAA